ncbi:thioesterase II family protein [Streptomyces sp. CG1]|uniref:thioesterase II family protein n=1 Tax=Streptomyces sp. CG1 TaxID=1287523 RepID=UPI0034E1ABEC
MDSTSWLRRFRKASNPRVRLVCFPHAGGAASFFASWQHRLPNDVEVLAVCYPGRENRINEACVEDMSQMVDGVVVHLEPLLDEGLVFFGHSMGAHIAFEVALRLEQTHGKGPLTLLVSGSEGPNYRARKKVTYNDETLLRHVRSLGHGDARLFEDPQLRSLLLPPLRSDFRLLENFRPPSGRKARVPITVYTGDRDPEVSPAGARSWSSATVGETSIVTYSGDHFYLIESQAELLQDVSERLARVDRFVSSHPDT